MNKKILKATFGAVLLFGAAFYFGIENADAKAGPDLDFHIECKGDAGHCVEKDGITYYGKAHGTFTK